MERGVRSTLICLISLLELKIMNRILIVEDNKDILETTAEILELKGYAIKTAINGLEGLKLAKQSPPDLIVSDIMMPKMDGYQMLESLRLDAKTAKIPFIFLTAKTQKTDVLRGAISGADRYLTKPFTMAELLKTVKEIIDVLPKKE